MKHRRVKRKLTALPLSEQNLEIRKKLSKMPEPPVGYIPFKWKTKRVDGCSQNLCPKCGEFSFAGDGGGWTSKKAQRLYVDLAKSGKYNSYDLLCEKIDGVMLKCHWSRFGMGSCINCNLRYWHDFIGMNWNYYHEPYQ